MINVCSWSFNPYRSTYNSWSWWKLTVQLTVWVDIFVFGTAPPIGGPLQQLLVFALHIIYPRSHTTGPTFIPKPVLEQPMCDAFSKNNYYDRWFKIITAFSTISILYIAIWLCTTYFEPWDYIYKTTGHSSVSACVSYSRGHDRVRTGFWLMCYNLSTRILMSQANTSVLT